MINQSNEGVSYHLTTLDDRWIEGTLLALIIPFAGHWLYSYTYSNVFQNECFPLSRPGKAAAGGAPMPSNGWDSADLQNPSRMKQPIPLLLHHCERRPACFSQKNTLVLHFSLYCNRSTLSSCSSTRSSQCPTAFG